MGDWNPARKTRMQEIVEESIAAERGLQPAGMQGGPRRCQRLECGIVPKLLRLESNASSLRMPGRVDEAGTFLRQPLFNRDPVQSFYMPIHEQVVRRPVMAVHRHCTLERQRGIPTLLLIGEMEVI